MTTLPAGMVTFLFTDIEGSTRLWERDRAAMTRAAGRHDTLLAAAIAAHGGVLFKHVGDAVQAAFATPAAAIAAAVAAQVALAAEPWAESGPLRARMAIHRGQATPNAGGDYHQVPSLNRLARLMAAGHGGQILLSDAVRADVAGSLPGAVTLRDLGRHRLRDLLEPERISQLVIAGLPADFPPLKTLEGHATNLPTVPTPLIGRETEVAEIVALLGEGGARLVTLVGPGGVGKTHLALQAAADLLDRFVDGVWLVRLGDVNDPELILPAIAAVIGVREGGGLDLRQALLHWLTAKRVLFVLDNLEQVVTGAPVIAALLEERPGASVLATSRQRLGIGGERVSVVQPLPLVRETQDLDDFARNPAVRLFVARATAAAPGFVLGATNAVIIASICIRLDGLPLAIELAAAQLRTRTPRELLADLDHRFELLVGGRREALSHQQSLAATIAWSYDRLDPEARRLLRLVSVCAGGFTLDAAEDVGGRGGTGGLAALVEQSLVRHEALPDDTSRWSLLESIRVFARDRLDEAGEAPLAHDRHAAWCLTFAENAGRHLDGAEAEAWLARLDREHDNARAALRWAMDTGASERALALAGAMAAYWQLRGHLSEGRRWLEGALRQTGTVHPAALRAMLEAGVLAQTQGDLAGAGEWYTRALAAAREHGDRGREASLLNNLGALALTLGELDVAEQRFTESLALAEAIGDERRRADALANLGALAHYRDDIDGALRRYTDCLHIWRELGDARGAAEMLLNILLLLAPWPAYRQRARAAGEEALRRHRALGNRQGEGLALTGLGLIAAEEGDLDRAAELHEESLARFLELEDRINEARARGNLGLVELDRGHLDRADGLLARSLRLAHEQGDLVGVATGLEAAAAVRVATGDDERAARVAGAATALRQRIGVPLPPESRARKEALTATLRQRLGDQCGDHAAAGAALTVDEAVREALAHQPASSGDPLAASLRALDDMLDLDLDFDLDPAGERSDRR